MKNIIQIILYSILIVVFVYCGEDDTIANPDPDSEEKVVGINSLSYSTARQGEKIIVRGFGFSQFYLLHVFNGYQYINSNITSDSTISLFLPFSVEGNTYEYYFISANLDTILYNSELVLTEKCEQQLCIDWNTKDSIIESDSWIRAWSSDSFVKWDKELRNDTLFIFRDDLCHDECHYWHTLAFRIIENNELPEFLFASNKILTWPDPDINDTLRNCVIRIDKWDSTSIYSGTFTSSEHSWIFWVSNE